MFLFHRLVGFGFGVFFLHSVSLFGYGSPRTRYINQAGLVRDLPAASRALGLKVCATVPYLLWVLSMSR